MGFGVPRSGDLLTEKNTGTNVQAAVRRRRDKPIPIGITWLTLLICLGILVAGWLLGKPMTPELLGMLTVITGWAIRSETAWNRRLADHSAGIRALSDSQEVSTGRAETVYDLVERQLEAEKKPPKKLRQRSP